MLKKINDRLFSNSQAGNSEETITLTRTED